MEGTEGTPPSHYTVVPADGDILLTHIGGGFRPGHVKIAADRIMTGAPGGTLTVAASAGLSQSEQVSGTYSRSIGAAAAGAEIPSAMRQERRILEPFTTGPGGSGKDSKRR
jgi:hypothetical protein